MSTLPAVMPRSQPPLLRSPRRKSSDRIRIGLFGPGNAWPAAVTSVLCGSPWCEIVRLSAREMNTESDALGAIDAAVVFFGDAARRENAAVTAEWAAMASAVIPMLQSRRIGLVWLSDASDDVGDESSTTVVLPTDVSIERLRGTLVALAHVRPMWQRIERELTELQTLGDHVRGQFTSIENELALAARLQRDFLPRDLPRGPTCEFATLYRPCSWVSGDMLDLFRIDDRRIGFYIVDAMGHGVAAALLTMYIRNALRPHPAGGEPRLPSDVLTALNETLHAERLPDCQFVTGWYGLFDTQTRELAYASGGHPAALVVSRDRSTTDLDPTGGLLGVFAAQSFSTRSIRLDPGSRLLVFSDGVENVLRSSLTPEPTQAVMDGVGELACKPLTLTGGTAAHLVECIARRLDDEPGAFGPNADDASVIVLDVK